MSLLTSSFSMSKIILIFLAISCSKTSAAEEQQPKIDPAADARIRAMSQYLAEKKSFSVNVTHEMEMQQEGEEKQSYSDQRSITIQRPNRLAVVGSGDGEGQLVCDGQQLLAYLPSYERYTLVDSPDTIDDILQQEAALLLGAGSTVIQLAAADAYEQFLESVKTVSLLEPEQVSKITCDRIEMIQEKSKVLLWIEQGDRPLLHKMQWEIQVDLPEGVDFEMPSQVVTFSDWKIEQSIAEDTFTIEVPEDAEQVDSLMMQAGLEEGPHPLVGEEAPDCELQLLDGDPQKLSDLEGERVVVLDFWAIWCGPCVQALPIIDKVATDFADQDIAFYAVNLGDEAEAIQEFLEKHKLKLPIAIDPKSKLANLFQANSIPMTMIVDKQGKVQVVHTGFGGGLEKTLTEEIEAVLDGKQLAEETLQAARKAKQWGEPIPAGEDAITSKDAIKYTVAFNLRTSVDAYKKVGSRSEEWDEAAIEFLNEMTTHFSSAEGYKSQIELIEMAEPLVESGCDDPLVQYCHGAMLEDGGKDKASKARGSRFVERSYDGLVERGYPASRCYAAARRIWVKLKQNKNQAEKAEKYLALTQKHALESLLQDDLTGNDGRTIYSHLSAFVESLPLETRKEFCEDAKAHAEASPFVVNMLLGQYHRDAAWKVRGSGFAPEVTEKGWKGFAEHIELAREFHEKAWEAAPHRPEAAAKMIAIAMASSRSPYREMRIWFDRAVQAQFDYYNAYHSLYWALMPRWHGSHDLMYQFGLECIATERYDTNIPYLLCEILWRITRDEAHNPLGNQYLRRPGIYEDVKEVCQRYIEQEGVEHNIPWWKTTWLGFAYLTNHWEDAEDLLAELESELNADALGRFPLPADEVISATRLNSSPHAESITKAFRDADNGQRQQAMDALTEILEAEDLKPIIAGKIKSRLQGLKWSIDFDEGMPIKLMPSENLYGWKIAAGDWLQTPEGELRGVSSNSGVMLECETDFGTHWEISGEVIHGKSPYNPWDVGILLNVDGRPQYSIMFNPTEKWVAAAQHRKLKKHRQDFEAQGKTTKFKGRVEGDTVNVWLNENHVIEDQEIDGLSRTPSSRLTIGAKYWWAGSTLTYRDLVIEKITEE